jgi:hypothetical protein
MPVKLSKSLAEYFAASNTDDADRIAACFTADAIVHDEGGDIRGRDAVRAWAEETRRKYRFHAEVRMVPPQASGFTGGIRTGLARSAPELFSCGQRAASRDFSVTMAWK